MPKVTIGLGSNIGNREDFLEKAKTEITKLEDTKIIEKSSIIETKPYGVTDQANFLNQVIVIETDLKPLPLLNKLQIIEKKLDRVREKKWGPRTIDLDILFYDNRIINLPSLKIPHPEIHKRKFVLKSLIEICPDFKHPTIKKVIKQIYKDLSKQT